MQLVGLTALFIASKFEEVAPPEVTDFVYIAADAYTKEDLIEMEIRTRLERCVGMKSSNILGRRRGHGKTHQAKSTDVLLLPICRRVNSPC